MAFEAKVMEYLVSAGYPVPAIDSLSEDGTELVMQRIDGPTMVEMIGRAPWKIRRFADALADLHQRLHAIPAPDFLPPAPIGDGRSIVHMDLHPLNVIMGPDGPVVIDWPRASRGDPATDVGVAWMLMAAGEIPGSPIKAKLLGTGRSMFVNRFLSHFDRATLSRHLTVVVEWKALDPNIAPAEVATMRRLAASV